jgi:S1-C subfamily serine protease
LHLLSALLAFSLLSPQTHGSVRPTTWPNAAANVTVMSNAAVAGTACVVGPGILYTAGHIAEHGNLSIVSGPVTAPAVVFALDKKKDFAILKVEGVPLVSAPIAPQPPEQGEEVMLSGFLINNPKRVPYIGRILDINNENGGHLEIDGTIYPGTSGSCVLNKRGEVVGIAIVLTGGENVERGFYPRAVAGAVPIWGKQ